MYDEWDVMPGPIGVRPPIERPVTPPDWELVAAQESAEAAISEYYRYQTGGETRGSYDGKTERNGLWKAMYKALPTLAALRANGKDQG